MATAKKKSKIPDGLSIYKSGKKNKRWRIAESGLKIGGATEGYFNLDDIAANLTTIHHYTSPAAIKKALTAYKARKR